MDERARRVHRETAERLLAERGPEGHWRGRLSTSALSTATAVFALIAVERHRSRPLPISGEDLRDLIEGGRGWLAGSIGDDGGWGDTVTSPSNLSTTSLCWAALSADPADGETERDALEQASGYIRGKVGSLRPTDLSQAIQAIYGKDKTFSVPILTMCALAGCLGTGREAWKNIPALPFELAIFPRTWFKNLGLPVVSYALPALIAMGQTQHQHAPTRFLPLRWLRERSRPSTLKLLANLQPETGGFLEAVPLTSFVTMSLATSRAADNGVVDEAVRFLADSVLEDGSWPIDVDLATWGTTLSINALAESDEPALDDSAKQTLLEWLLGQQHRQVHPFTNADPGGWAWTDLPGGVPDADDTSGALLALASLAGDETRVRSAAADAVQWLVDLQNRDGGIPTFCRGWGSLPFDRSSADISAHVLRAWHAWEENLSESLVQQVQKSRQRLLKFLEREQRTDGSWIPLWFGNQLAPGNENPTYGTSRVVLALATTQTAKTACQRGTEWLLKAQNSDGGWGGAPGVASSVEETALALEALAEVQRRTPRNEVGDAIHKGVAYLVEHLEAGASDQPTPIGLYFADLWYSEKLYPLVFSVSALARCSLNRD